MVTLLYGDNSFEIERALARISNDFDGVVEKNTGSELQLVQLPDILMGVSLFATKRLVVIRNLSDNKTIWPIFGNWLSKISDDISLVLIESKPDKRTTTFKALKDNADIKEFPAWNDRDVDKAEKWVINEATALGVEINRDNARLLVGRVGIDQWQLFHSLEKLALIGTISADNIIDIVDSNPIENVFELFETAMKRDMAELKRLLRTLEQSEDVYRLSALLFTQAFQLAVVSSADKSANTSKDFDIHPYVLSKLDIAAKRMGKNGVSKIVNFFAQADDGMKLSKAEPWLLIESALFKIASL